MALQQDKDTTYVVDNNRTRILTLKDNIVNHINDDFGYIDDIAVDDKGIIYLIDTSWEADSFKVSADTIYSYNPKTGKKKEIFKSSYKTATKHQMFGIKIIDNKIHVVTANESNLSHLIMDKKGKITDSYFYTMNSAVTVLQDISVSKKDGSLIAIDKRGKLLRFSTTKDVGKIDEIFDWTKLDKDKMVEPYRLDIDMDSNIYLTDIVSNKLFKISFEDDNFKNPTFETIGKEHEGNFKIKTSSFDNKNYIGTTDNGSFKIYDSNGKVVRDGSSIKYNNYYLFILISLFIARIIACIGGLWLLIRLLFILFANKLTTPQLLSRVVFVSILLVSSIITIQLFTSFYGMLRNEKISKLEMLANNAAREIDTDSLENITKPSDYMNEDFKQIHNSLNTSLDYSYDSSMYANIVRWDKETDKVYDIVFYDNSIGAYYPLLGSEADEVKEVYKKKDYVTSSSSTENGGFIYAKAPILNNSGDVVGVVEIGTWSATIRGQVTKIIQDIIIQLIIWLVLILFVYNEIFEILNLKEKDEKKRGSGEMPLFMNRAVIFMVFFAYNLPTAFLPVFVSNMYKGGWPVANSFAKSMPISINMILIGLSALTGYKIMKYFSFTKAMIFGAFMTLIGDLMLAISPNYVFILIGLMLNGMGVGLQMNLMHSINSYIAAKRKDNTIFTIYQAGSLSGIMVGMSFGAILADYIGYRNVFFITVLVWATIAFSSLYMGKKYGVKKGEDNTQLNEAAMNDEEMAKVINKANGQATDKTMSTASFLLSLRILSFLVLILFMYVITSSFVYYYVPIYIDSLGYGSNITCLFIMINSVCGIYLSSSTTRLFSNKFGNKAIYISSGISLVALMLFALLPSINILLLALFMLGFSTSFGTATRLAVFSKIPKVREYGLDRATGVYDLTERSGEAVGPLVFAALFAGNFLKGMTIFAIISIVACILFSILSRVAIFSELKKSKKNKKNNKKK
ncbi:MAG: MFS transporter [Lachnospiraceae bacterium]|nr:MFS transporter [Lachnospiraceae bacterium]